MKELCEYCLDDRRDTMDVAVGNRRCTETSPTPNLFKPIHISDIRATAEAQKPRRRIGIAEWKAFARLESFLRATKVPLFRTES